VLGHQIDPPTLWWPLPQAVPCITYHVTVTHLGKDYGACGTAFNEGDGIRVVNVSVTSSNVSPGDVDQVIEKGVKEIMVACRL
jgi:hypothetical protein